MEEKKPNVTVPNYVYEVLMRDIEIFRTNKNNLCNTIFKELNRYNQDITEVEDTRAIRFNFQKKNIFAFGEFIKGRGGESESEMLCKLFTAYVNMPQYKREIILNREKISKIEDAIKRKIKISIETYRGRRIVEPYFITNNKEEEYNYLICRKEGEDRIVNYRLMNIADVNLISEKYDISKEQNEILEKMKTNFDPFLSIDKKITIKFSAEGIELFQTVVHNRPKLVEPKKISDMDINKAVVVECSERKAIAYFMQFGAGVEIIEPKDIRDKFREIYTKGYKNYMQ